MKPVDGPAGATQDFTDLHAWAEVYIPGAGWVGLRSDLGPAVPARATSRSPPRRITAPPRRSPARSSAAEVDVRFRNDRRRASSRTPRVTFPYRDDAMGRDRRARRRASMTILQRQDVRLTMGGEPTFVSIDDNRVGRMEHRRARARPSAPGRRCSIRRLRDRFAHGRLAALRPGQMVSGRAAAALGLRAVTGARTACRSGATTSSIAAEADDFGHADDAAALLRKAWPTRLGIDPQVRLRRLRGRLALHVRGGRAARQRRSGRPARSTIRGARAHLRRVFASGLECGRSATCCRCSAPMRCTARRWLSEHVARCARERLMLIPGDSPMGFRLPLESLPCAAASSEPSRSPARSVRRRAADCRRPERPFQRAAATASGNPRERGRHVRSARSANVAEIGQPDAHLVRTALCVEPRDGRLHVFMPPTDTARGLSRTDRRRRGRPPPNWACPCTSKAIPPPLRSAHQRHQGHARPGRHRGQYPARRATGPKRSRITDGALRGGAPVASRHREIPARRPPHRHRRRQSHRGRRRDRRPTARSCAGPTCCKSLVLLLAEPSVALLSVLRACSSARPARRRASTKRATTCSTNCEIAFGQVPAKDAAHVPPWLVDRIFRNLLIDVTGNTHRAEICIDKLYSPDGPTGRLGLRRIPQLRNAARTRG